MVSRPLGAQERCPGGCLVFARFIVFPPFHWMKACRPGFPSPRIIFSSPESLRKQLNLGFSQHRERRVTLPESFKLWLYLLNLNV